MADDEERVINGDFTETTPGPYPWSRVRPKYWNYGSECGEDMWEVFVTTDEPPNFCSVNSYYILCETWLSQNVDLTNVNEITWNARCWLWPDFCGPAWVRLYIDDNVVWESTENIEEFAAQSADVSMYSGIHTVKFGTRGTECSARQDVKNISAIASGAPPIEASLLWQLQIGPI